MRQGPSPKEYIAATNYDELKHTWRHSQERAARSIAERMHTSVSKECTQRWQRDC